MRIHGGKLLMMSAMAAALCWSDAATAWSRKLTGDAKVLHALNRLTFGPRPGDVERVRKMGLDRWIERQLHPATIEESPVLAERLAPLDSVRMPMGEMTVKYPPRQLIRAVANAKLPERVTAGMSDAQRRALDRLAGQYKARLGGAGGSEAAASPPRVRGLRDLSFEKRREELARYAPQLLITSDLIENKLYRAVYSERQLEEVLVDFWFNHFNVYLNKGPVRHLTTSYERDAIRPFVLGKFRDMLRATAEHPAMLFYLDNWRSVDPEAAVRMRGNSRGARVQALLRARGLNENYGRELLELHTLGVDGGYTQKDVVEVARCFTGWTIGTLLYDPRFQYVDRVHDKGGKIVLGHRIPAGGGMEDGLRVLDILAAHPSTAKFLSRKLAQRFVADDPPQALVDHMAATYLKSGGDLREVMRTMFHSREFFSQGAYRAKMKSPLEMAVSAVRALDAGVQAALPLSKAIEELGQPLYRKEEPTGYKDTTGEWVNTAGLLARMNFSLQLAAGKLRGIEVVSGRLPSSDLRQAALFLLHDEPTFALRSALEKGLEGRQATPAQVAGLVLGSPEFQRR